jgi:hypothetical protein
MNLGSLSESLVGLPGWWVIVGVIITVVMLNWKRGWGAAAGLVFCGMLALWGHGIYQLNGHVSLLGLVTLREGGFYLVVGILAAYNAWVLWEQLLGLQHRSRLKHFNKKYKSQYK